MATAQTLVGGLGHDVASPVDSTEAVASTAPAPVSSSGHQPDDELIGTVIGERYRLVEKLGAGGMGTVYRGEHITLKKRVAVKFLHREMSANPELVTRFEREASTAANLDHPNVVAATDFGRLPDGTFYLVMEFVEGRSLRKVIQDDGRFHPLRVLRILRQIGAALSRAHSMGVVHRDLKPENIVVADREGERDVVKVIDFGIARVTKADGPALTQLGTVFGTPEYMAPEQAMGQPVDAAADQYALGVIAYELFTGGRPFHADDAVDLLRMHVGAPVTPPSERATDVPAALDPVLMRMLAKRPVERFENVPSALMALEQALATAAVPSQIVSRAAMAAPPAASSIAGAIPRFTPAAAPGDPRERNRIIGLGLAFAGLLVLAIILAIATRTTAPSPLAPVVPARPVDVRPLDQRMFAYQQQPDVAQAMSRMYTGDTVGAAAPLEARRRADPSDGLAAYFLGTVLRNARRLGPALEQFGTAVRLEPALADDSTLATAAVEGLADATTATAAAALLRGPLARSRTAARAVADEAISGSSPASRGTALDLADAMQSLLTPLDRARVRLRLARTCEELRAALGALESLGEGTPRDEARAVRAGECDMLRMGARCESCIEDHGRRR